MGLNELKLILHAQKTLLLYENVLSIVTKLLLFSCSRALKLAKKCMILAVFDLDTV